MGNKQLGVVEFMAGEKGHKLSFSANALCELEDALDQDVDAITGMLAGGGNVRLKILRTIFWKGLIDHWPEATLDDAKGILAQLPPLRMGQLIGEAFKLALPDVTVPADPPQPGGQSDGTGPASGADGLS